MKIKINILLVVTVLLFCITATNLHATTSFGTASFTDIGNGTSVMTITYTDDTNGHTGFAISVPSDHRGKVPFCAKHKPGATAMTATADIEVRLDGISIFGTGLHDCGGTSNKGADFTVYAPLLYTGLTIYITGNAVNNATGTIELYMR